LIEDKEDLQFRKWGNGGN